ncbi:unnamed protein product [Clavelina lepadiformis]|uniref:Uncharacterized protein n=1 Tax=Clavelina lepadiformis TaxID=159417 RepID=A0ABP0H194_CLALP
MGVQITFVLPARKVSITERGSKVDDRVWTATSSGRVRVQTRTDSSISKQTFWLKSNLKEGTFTLQTFSKDFYICINKHQKTFELIQHKKFSKKNCSFKKSRYRKNQTIVHYTNGKDKNVLISSGGDIKVVKMEFNNPEMTFWGFNRAI